MSILNTLNHNVGLFQILYGVPQGFVLGPLHLIQHSSQYCQLIQQQTVTRETYLASFLGTNSLSVLMCRKAVSQLGTI